MNTFSDRISWQTPLWFSDFTTSVKRDHRRMAEFSPYGDYQEPPDLGEGIRDNLLIADGHADFRTLRQGSREDIWRQRQTGEELVYVGNSCFLRLRGGYPAWYNQKLYHLACDRARLRSREESFFCLDSACRQLQIPLYVDEPVVHLCWNKPYSAGRAQQPRKTSRLYSVNMVRHSYHVDADEIVSIDGYATTNEFRTLQDVLAYFPDPFFIVPADALLGRLVAVDFYHRTYDKDKYNAVKHMLYQRIRDIPRPYPAKKVMHRFQQLSPLAQSPGESLLRFFFLTMGFPMPQVQYPISYDDEDGYPRDSRSLGEVPAGAGGEAVGRAGVGGSSVGRAGLGREHVAQTRAGGHHVRQRTIFVDMAWPELDLAVEFDGIGKYSDVSVVEAEKNREHLITSNFTFFRRFVPRNFLSWQYFRQTVARCIAANADSPLRQAS